MALFSMDMMPIMEMIEQGHESVVDIGGFGGTQGPGKSLGSNSVDFRVAVVPAEGRSGGQVCRHCLRFGRSFVPHGWFRRQRRKSKAAGGGALKSSPQVN